VIQFLCEDPLIFLRQINFGLHNDLTNNWYYEPQVIISNTNKGLLSFCVDYYSGWIAKLKKCKRKHSVAY